MDFNSSPNLFIRLTPLLSSFIRFQSMNRFYFWPTRMRLTIRSYFVWYLNSHWRIVLRMFYLWMEYAAWVLDTCVWCVKWQTIKKKNPPWWLQIRICHYRLNELRFHRPKTRQTSGVRKNKAQVNKSYLSIAYSIYLSQQTI